MDDRPVPPLLQLHRQLLEHQYGVNCNLARHTNKICSYRSWLLFACTICIARSHCNKNLKSCFEKLFTQLSQILPSLDPVLAMLQFPNPGLCIPKEHNAILFTAGHAQKTSIEKKNRTLAATR